MVVVDLLEVKVGPGAQTLHGLVFLAAEHPDVRGDQRPPPVRDGDGEQTRRGLRETVRDQALAQDGVLGRQHGPEGGDPVHQVFLVTRDLGKLGRRLRDHPRPVLGVRLGHGARRSVEDDLDRPVGRLHVIDPRLIGSDLLAQLQRQLELGEERPDGLDEILGERCEGDLRHERLPCGRARRQVPNTVVGATSCG